MPHYIVIKIGARTWTIASLTSGRCSAASYCLTREVYQNQRLAIDACERRNEVKDAFRSPDGSERP